MMSRRMVVAIVSFIASSVSTLNAQKVSISNMNKNVVALGQNNPLMIMVENTSCQSVMVTTDNGTIRKTGPCTYDYKPNKIGMAQLVVSAPGRSAFNYILRVEKGGVVDIRSIDEQIGVPGTVAMMSIGNIMGGNIAKDYLAAQVGLIIRDKTGNISKKYRLSSFQYAAFRNAQLVFSGVNNGVSFGEQLIKHLGFLQSGDIFTIFGCKLDDGDKNILVSPLEFRVN